MRNRKPGRHCWVNLVIQSHIKPWHPILDGVKPKARSNKGLTRQTLHDDQSRQEWGWIMGCLEYGVPVEIVLLHLINRALPRRGHDATRYALHTIRRACGRLGIIPP